MSSSHDPKHGSFDVYVLIISDTFDMVLGEVSNFQLSHNF